MDCFQSPPSLNAEEKKAIARRERLLLCPQTCQNQFEMFLQRAIAAVSLWRTSQELHKNRCRFSFSACSCIASLHKWHPTALQAGSCGMPNATGNSQQTYAAGGLLCEENFGLASNDARKAAQESVPSTPRFRARSGARLQKALHALLLGPQAPSSACLNSFRIYECPSTQ